MELDMPTGNAMSAGAPLAKGKLDAHGGIGFDEVEYHAVGAPV